MEDRKLVEKLRDNLTVYAGLNKQERRCLQKYQEHVGIFNQRTKDTEKIGTIKTFVRDPYRTIYRFDPNFYIVAKWMRDKFQLIPITRDLTITESDGTEYQAVQLPDGAICTLDKIVAHVKFEGFVYEHDLDTRCVDPCRFLYNFGLRASCAEADSQITRPCYVLFAKDGGSNEKK